MFLKVEIIKVHQRNLFDFTPVFIDLVDNYNQRVGFPANFGPNDNVTNYTLPQIESGFMKHVYGLTSLSRELKNNKPVGVSDLQIDELLSYYFNL